MWADEYGMIHVNQDEQSENGVLYTAEYYLLQLLAGYKNPYLMALWLKLIKKHEYKPGLYKQTPWGIGRDRASHDNMTAIMVMSYMLHLNEHKRARIFGEYWHPRDILFYLYLKTSSELLKWVYLPLPCLDMIRTCLRTYKRRNGAKMIATDGKLLAWVRLQTRSLAIKTN